MIRLYRLQKGGEGEKREIYREGSDFCKRQYRLIHIVFLGVAQTDRASDEYCSVSRNHRMGIWLPVLEHAARSEFPLHDDPSLTRISNVLVSISSPSAVLPFEIRMPR